MAAGKVLQILYLEDEPDDVALVRRALERGGLEAKVHGVVTREDFLEALRSAPIDLVLSDSGLIGFDGVTALDLVKQRHPHLPFLFVSGGLSDDYAIGHLKARGATNCINKAHLERLTPAIRAAIQERQTEQELPAGDWYTNAIEHLVTVGQELSQARSLDAVITIVCRATRTLTRAEGAAFILRDGDMCYYADENAIRPLWKGRRFRMSACVSGWVMTNRQPAVIEDVQVDPRTPAEVYRSTFVRGLAMIPICTSSPIGAIGSYWATEHLADARELKILQTLADSASVAIENVQLHAELEQRILDRTARLEAANKELEGFSYSISHDLRAPLRSIDGFTRILQEEAAGPLNKQAADCLDRILRATTRMNRLIDDLLTLSRTMSAPMEKEPVNLSQIASEIADALRAAAPERKVEFLIAPDLKANGDAALLRVVLENLFANAWKFTAKTGKARIELGIATDTTGQSAYFVRDNGAGFDMQYAQRLFGAFQRMHTEAEYPGTGIGLATVQRVIQRHGGRIWAEAKVEHGATFFFTLP